MQAIQLDLQWHIKAPEHPRLDVGQCDLEARDQHHAAILFSSMAAFQFHGRDSGKRRDLLPTGPLSIY